MPESFHYFTSGSLVVLMSGELNSLANNNLAPGLVDYNNASGYPSAEFEWQGAAASFGAATSISLWLLRGVTSGTYENGTSGVTPTRLPDVVFPMQSGTTRVVRRAVIPPEAMRPLLKNDGTGVTLPSSGNIIRIKPFSMQVVSGA